MIVFCMRAAIKTQSPAVRVAGVCVECLVHGIVDRCRQWISCVGGCSNHFLPVRALHVGCGRKHQYFRRLGYG